jgi:hypothetical protein
MSQPPLNSYASGRALAGPVYAAQPQPLVSTRSRGPGGSGRELRAGDLASRKKSLNILDSTPVMDEADGDAQGAPYMSPQRARHASPAVAQPLLPSMSPSRAGPQQSPSALAAQEFGTNELLVRRRC